MNMRYLLFLLLAGIHTSLSIYGQSESKAEVYGKVREYNDDGFGKQLLPTRGATVQLAAGKDTLYTTTNYDGIFLFKNIKPQIIQLKIFLLGKKTIEGEYELEGGRNAFYFTMENASEQIESAKVTADAQLSHQLADTTIYNVKLLHMLEGESARALLEQLPGFAVKENRIEVDGEPVKRTYVNGVLVFGDSPVTAIDALKADEVVQVNVYDELSPEDERRGITHAKKQRVLDIKTLEKIVSVTDAVLLAEGGADEYGQARYQGMGAVAFWSEMTNMSAFVSGDNLSSTIQSDDKYSQATPLQLAAIAMSHSLPLNTYSESLTAKIGFAKYWKDRLYGNSVRGTYSFGNNYLKSASNALTQYYQEDNSPAMAYYDTTSSSSVMKRHVFSVMADLHDTPLKSILLTAFGSVENTANDAIDIERIISDDIKYRQELSGGKIGNHNFSVGAQWTNNDLEKLKPSLEVNAGFTNERNVSWKVDTLASSYTRRKLSSDGKGNGVNLNATARLSYAVFNDEMRALSINGDYRFNYHDIIKRQMSIDSLDVKNPKISTGSTFDYTWKDVSHGVSLGCSYFTRKLQIDGGLAFMATAVLGEDRFPEAAPTDKHYYSVLPSVALKYGNLSFSASTRTETPSREQLCAIISDANPMVLTAGNPLLDKSYVLTEKLSWSKPLKKYNGRLLLSLGGESSFSPIVSKSEYFGTKTILSEYAGYAALAGARLYRYENSPAPSWTVNGMATYSGVFCKRKLIASSSLSGRFSQVPQYVGDDIVKFNDTRLSSSVNLRYTHSKNLKISFSPSVSYVNSSNSNSQMLAESIGISVPLNVNCIIFKHGFIKVDNRFGYSHYLSGLGSDITTDFLSATAGWRFLKNALTVSASANDIFNASTKYVTSATAQYFNQTWTPNYGRYYLLSVIYEFRKKQ